MYIERMNAERGVWMLAGVLALLVGGSLWAEGNVAPGVMPHGVCYTWLPSLLWLHVGSDLLIGLAYVSIPVTLTVLVRRRGDLPFNGVFLLFGLFIVSCGITHFMEVLTIWQPWYWLSGAMKALTAAASVPTAAVLVWLLPRALAMPTVEQLRAAQRTLEDEVARRRATEAELRDAQAVLEQRVVERTRELAEANALLDTVLDRAPVGVGVWDAQGGFVRVNRALADIDGLPGDAHAGRTVDALLPGLAPALGDAIRVVASSGKPAGPLALEHRASGSSEPRHWRVSLYPVQVHGAPTAVGGIVEEVTERRRAERERARLLADAQAARAEAEQASREKDRFLATVSHELRTPLQAIVSWVQVLRHPAVGATDTARALARVERNVRVQARLIDELLDFARIRNGMLSLDPVPGHPAPSIERALDGARVVAEEAGVALHARLRLDEARCAIDADRFQQVVANLLGNAIKFTPRGGRVDVEADGSAQGLVLSVADTGIGIEPDEIERIFEPFLQSREGARVGGGLGLGLSIARGIVAGLGGSIDAFSDGPGRGARFVVRLPPLRADAAAHDGASSESPPSDAEVSLDGVRLLLVEDDPDSAEAIAHGLRRLGATVRMAASVSEAIEAIEAVAGFEPDALVSDLKLGDGSGLSLPEALSRRLGRTLPSLAVSAYGRREDRAASRAAGFAGHEVKPIGADAIAAALHAIGVGTRQG